MDEFPSPNRAVDWIVAESHAVDRRQILRRARFRRCPARRFAAPPARRRRCAPASRDGWREYPASGRIVLADQRGAHVAGARERTEETRGADRRHSRRAAMTLMPIWSASSSCWREKPAMVLAALAWTSSPFSRFWMTRAAWVITAARLFLLRAQKGVTRGDMGDLMRHHRGDFGGVVGQRQQAARHEQVAGGQREGVDDGRIENGDAIGLGRGVAGLGQADQHVIEVIFRLGPVIFAAEKRDQLLAFGCSGVSPSAFGRAMGRGRLRHDALMLQRRAATEQQRTAASVSPDAAGEQKTPPLRPFTPPAVIEPARQNSLARARAGAVLKINSTPLRGVGAGGASVYDASSINSIWPGWNKSICGAKPISTTPRARTRRFTRVLSEKPARSKAVDCAAPPPAKRRRAAPRN